MSQTLVGIIGKIAEMQIRTLERIRTTIAESVRVERDGLRELANSLTSDVDAEFLESLGSDDSELRSAEELLAKLLVVGLYRAVESTTKVALRLSVKVSGVEVNADDCYRIKALEKHLREHFGTLLSDIDGFEKIDTLRLLNNTVKHESDLPRQALESHDTPESLDAIESFDALKIEVPNYLRSLARVLFRT